MQQRTLPRLFVVQRLFRRVLKLHRHMPADIKKLGDEYAKDEFRRHRGANQLQAFEFMNEWKNYCDTMETQLFGTVDMLGKDLQQNEVESLSQEQLGQLFELQQEASKDAKEEDSK